MDEAYRTNKRELVSRIRAAVSQFKAANAEAGITGRRWPRKNYLVIKKEMRLGTRWVVVDANDEAKIIDDAQGYGFKKRSSAVHIAATKARAPR